jgi:hypothetical protein
MRLDDLRRDPDRFAVTVHGEPARCFRLATKDESQRIAGKKTAKFRGQGAQELFRLLVDTQSVSETEKSAIMLF